MVVWGMIVALICLVNSYRGLVMYATRVIRLSFTHYEQRSFLPWIG